MKVVVVGATGTIGSAVAAALEPAHEVVRGSRSGEPRVDLAEPESIAALFASVGDVDAVVCCAASAPLTPLSDAGFVASLEGKLLGQVQLVRDALAHVRDGGSITLTSGKIPQDTVGGAGGALVNAGWTARMALPYATSPGPTWRPSRGPHRARRSSPRPDCAVPTPCSRGSDRHGP
jgi:NAD(P)-dependent dehydrogenase (short-subunit alcohol dehydrogenase family)